MPLSARKPIGTRPWQLPRPSAADQYCALRTFLLRLRAYPSGMTVIWRRLQKEMAVRQPWRIAYRNDGLDVFRRVGGSFSLTIVDQRSGRGDAAVNRMGIGRLYYACFRDGGIVFGTTADGVREFPKLSATMSPQGLYDYLFSSLAPRRARFVPNRKI